MNFSGKNLLILTNSYPDEDNRHYGGIFVKEQVRYLARYFNEIYVISPQPYGSNRNLRDYGIVLLMTVALIEYFGGLTNVWD